MGHWSAAGTGTSKQFCVIHKWMVDENVTTVFLCIGEGRAIILSNIASKDRSLAAVEPYRTRSTTWMEPSEILGVR